MFARILGQSFARQRARQSLAAAAVIAGMTVVSALLALRVGVGDELHRELEAYGANIRVSPAADSLPLTLNGVDLRPADAGADLPEAALGKIKQVFWGNNITAFAPQLFVPAAIAPASGAALVASGPRSAATSGSAPAAVTIEGTYFDRAVPIPGRIAPFRTGVEHLDPSWRVDGQWPSDAAVNGETQALAGARLAARDGLRIGETVLARSGQAEERLTITGILSTGEGQDDELVVPLPAAQRLAGRPGEMRDVLVAAITKPEDSFSRQDPSRLPPAEAERWMCSPYAVSIARELADAIPGATAAPVRPVAESQGVILAKLHLLFWLIGLFALAASALAVASVMSAAVVERRGEIALMKALGAPDARVAGLLASEAILLGVVGGAVGFALGEWIAAALARGVLRAPLAWTPAVLPIAVLLACGAALLGAWGALRRATRLPPGLVLRGDA